jgi:hypothetical protein
VERGRGILKRVRRSNRKSSAEQPGGVAQDPAEGRDPESDNRPAGAEQTMGRLEFRRPDRSKEGVPKAPEQAAEAPGKSQGRAGEAVIVRSDESFRQKFADAERRLEEVEARLQAAEQLAAQAEHVAGLHPDESGQVRRTNDAEPNEPGRP